jgi:hypothetical protein
MIRFLNRLTLSALAGLLGGCSDGPGDAPAAITAAEAPKTVEAAFAGASADTRKAAVEMAGDISTNPEGAIHGFEQMSRSPDLTPEQRAAMAQAMAAAIAELQRAAASGSADAQKALEARAARK